MKPRNQSSAPVTALIYLANCYSCGCQVKLINLVKAPLCGECFDNMFGDLSFLDPIK